MEHMIQPCGSTVTSKTNATVGTSDQTVLHYNGPSTTTTPTAKWRNPLDNSNNELSLRYPHQDMSQTMKSCIDKIDEDHMRGNSNVNQPSEQQMTGIDRPAGWSSFFACCGNSIDESTLDHPPRALGGGSSGGQSVVTEDESDSVSTSDSSLDAILDQVGSTAAHMGSGSVAAGDSSTTGYSPASCPSEDAMLLESAKRDTSNDSARSKKRWRGPLRARSFGDSKQQQSPPPLSPRKSSPRESAGLDVEVQWRGHLKLENPPSPMIRSESNTIEQRRSRSYSNNGHIPLSPKTSTTEEYITSRLQSRSKSRSGSSEHGRSNSRSRSYDLDHVLQPEHCTGGGALVTGRRSRSNSGSRNYDLGYNLPPPSPSSKKLGLGNISGLDMLIELQKEEAEIEKKLTEDDRKEPSRHRRERQVRRSPQIRKTKGMKTGRIKVGKSNGKQHTSQSDRSLISLLDVPDIKGYASDTGPEIKRFIYGPRCGSFENVMTDGAIYGIEVNNTYATYRMDPEFARKVMSKMVFSLPMYHSVPSNNSTRGVKNVCSEPVATDFLIRGPSYMENSEKVVSREAVFSILGANNILNRKVETIGHVRTGPDDFVKKFRLACSQAGVQTPFLLIINFIVPWGTFSSYYYRPDGTNGGAFAESESEQPSEKLWRAFITGDDEFRNSKLKLIPNVVVGPWVLKKMVGPKPGMIGQKLPVSYNGSYQDGYFQINMDITRGGKVANSICAACANKASLIAVDLAFLLQGDSPQELPEQLLAVVRLHHIQLKKGSFQ